MRIWVGVAMLFLLAAGTSAPVWALTPAEVVSPRPASWVRDDAGMLPADAAAIIDARIEAARREHAVELAVLIVADIGAQEPRDFATAVFNTWGIGDPQRHDGVLVFIARDQRAAEIVLGQGIDGDAQVAASQWIMDEVLVPNLRRGDPTAGLLATVEAVLHRIHGIAPPAVEAAPAPLELERDAAPATLAPTPITAGPLRSSAAPVDSDQRSTQPWFMVVGGALAFFGAFGLRWWWRVRGRKCPRCNAAMQRLSEERDDAHLQPAQQLEERLGSVDYDVWSCSACTFVDTRRYGAWFSRYSRCPACAAATLSRSQTTLVHATYDQGGRVQVDEACQHCSHRRQFERSTPRKTRPRTGGTRGGRRGGSGFSGGRSSGRGASGKW